MLNSILVYISSFVLGSVIYWALFWSPLQKKQQIFFYRALFLLAFSTLLLCVLFIAPYLLFHLAFRDILISLLLFLCFHLNFLTLFLVSLDRSISIFLLAEMVEEEKSVFSEEELERLFLTVYVQRDGAMAQRFMEQVVSGNVIRVEGGYAITAKGKKLIKKLRRIANLFPVNRKILYPRGKQ